MSARLFSFTIAISVSALAASIAGQAAGTAPKTEKPWSVSHTPWGDPDLQGIWDNETATPFERPKELGTKAFWTPEEMVQRQAVELASETKRRRGEDDATRPDLTKSPISGNEYNRTFFDTGKPKRVIKQTSLIVDPADGRMPPLTPEALKRWAAREVARSGRGEGDSWEDRNPWERCLTYGGLPYEMNAGEQSPYKQILQTPGYVIIAIEMMHDVRIIPLDGRPHVSPSIRGYLGDSRGHWQGNTLVVDTTNFTDHQNGGPIMPSHQGIRFYDGSGETLHLVERFTRVDADSMDYEFTVTDPKTYLTPWSAVIPWNKDAAVKSILEYTCHEGNYGLADILKGARKNEASAVQGAAAEARQRQQRFDDESARTAEALRASKK
jgi:hypothetical protein